MKSLVLNLAVEGDHVDAGVVRYRGYDSNVLRPQREQSWALGQANSPRERVATNDARLYFATKQIGVPDELRSVGRRWMAIDLTRRSYLFQLAHTQQRNAVRHDHGFFLVMGNKHE